MHNEAVQIPLLAASTSCNLPAHLLTHTCTHTYIHTYTNAHTHWAGWLALTLHAMGPNAPVFQPCLVSNTVVQHPLVSLWRGRYGPVPSKHRSNPWPAKHPTQHLPLALQGLILVVHQADRRPVRSQGG